MTRPRFYLHTAHDCSAWCDPPDRHVQLMFGPEEFDWVGAYGYDPDTSEALQVTSFEPAPEAPPPDWSDREDVEYDPSVNRPWLVGWRRADVKLEHWDYEVECGEGWRARR